MWDASSLGKSNSRNYIGAFRKGWPGFTKLIYLSIEIQVFISSYLGNPWRSTWYLLTEYLKFPPWKSFLDLNELKSIQVGNEDVCNGVLLLHWRYRAIMYPLRRKPSKLFSKAVIFLIWILGLLFALPMGLLHSFGYVDDPAINESGQEVVRKKPFCYLDFGAASNATIQPPKLTFFKYYRYLWE